MNRRTLIKGLFASVALIYQPSVLSKDFYEEPFRAKSRKMVAKWDFPSAGEVWDNKASPKEWVEDMVRSMELERDNQFMEDIRTLLGEK